MISYRFVPISRQKGVLFLRHPVYSGSSSLSNAEQFFDSPDMATCGIKLCS